MASPASPSTAARGLTALAWWWAGVFAAGVALRVLAAYPPFRSPLESEITQTGLDALEILHGHARLARPESWLHVPSILLFGTTREALFLAPLAAGIALLAAYGFLARELLGEREGLAAFVLLAVPPPMVLLWSSLPGGDAETLLCMAAALACAARIGRRGAVPGAVLGFVLAAGLGWWCSPLSLAGTLPAALWIALRRSAPRRGPRAPGLAAGLLAGAIPWISFANAGRLAAGVTDLLLRRDCPRPAFFAPLVATAGALYLAALGLAVVRVGSRRSWGDGDGGRKVPALLLPLLVTVCTGALCAAAAAGGTAGDTVRSVLPLGLAAPLLMAGLWGLLSARSHAAGDALLLLLLVVNAAGYCLPWTARRQTEQRLARAEDHLLYLLKERRTAWVFGRPRDVDALRFLSGGTIEAIPDVGPAGFSGDERTLGGSPAPFALVSRQRGKVAAWARRAGLRGALVNVNNDFEAFFPAPAAESPGALIARLRVVASAL